MDNPIIIIFSHQIVTYKATENNLIKNFYYMQFLYTTCIENVGKTFSYKVFL